MKELTDYIRKYNPTLYEEIKARDRAYSKRYRMNVKLKKVTSKKVVIVKPAIVDFT